jgi:hypothetical protein
MSLNAKRLVSVKPINFLSNERRTGLFVLKKIRPEKALAE